VVTVDPELLHLYAAAVCRAVRFDTDDHPF
jgi:hypothetical protein